MTKRLLVLVNYRVSDILKKGEYISGYYNPGDLFDEIHLFLTVADQITTEEMQFTGGRAKVFIDSVPAPRFRESLGWHPLLLRKWVDECVALVREINPGIIRVHNPFIQGYLASEIKKRLGIPYIVSIHSVFDRDCLESFMARFMRLFSRKLEKRALSNSDAVIAVYEPIVRYAQRFGAKNIHLIYNAVAGDEIRRKQSYRVAGPARFITINQQILSKNPENIIRAIKEMDCTYEIIGDGPLHEHLKSVAKSCGCQEKVVFIKNVPNDVLMSRLKEYDLLVSHCDNWGISKSIIEGAIAGLPIIHNRHPVEPLPDFDGDWLRICDNSVEGYRQAILELLRDEKERQILGENANQHAMEYFSPTEMNRKIVDLYKSFLPA